MPLHHFITNFLEIIAAFSASYYLIKTKDFIIKPFVWYLWIIVIVETLGAYGYVLLNNYDYNWYIWLKNSPFCENRWLYNTLSLATVLLFGKFYNNILIDSLSKLIVKVSVIIYLIFSITYFLITDGFFVKSLPYDALLETILVFLFVTLYLKQILKSDDILIFYKLPVFYISLGLLLWYLVVTPLFIFDGYFYANNRNYVNFRVTYLFISNIFLYTCYTFGFLYTLRFKKQ